MSILLGLTTFTLGGCDLLQLTEVDRGPVQGRALIAEGNVDGADWRVTFDTPGGELCVYTFFPGDESASPDCLPAERLDEPLELVGSTGTERVEVFHGLARPDVRLVRIVTLEGAQEFAPPKLQITAAASAYAIAFPAFSRLVSIEALDDARNVLMVSDGPY